MRQSPWRPDRRALVAISVAGLAVAGLAARNVIVNLTQAYPHLEWSAINVTYVVALVTSCVALVLCGPWLWWRLPGNPTGWRITALGFVFSMWTAAVFFNSTAGPWIQIATLSLLRPLLFVSVLAWPTGRFEPVWRRRVLCVAVVYMVVLTSLWFIGPVDGPHPFGMAWPIPTIGSAGLGDFTNELTSVALIAAVSLAVLVAASRSFRRLPRAARPAGRWALSAAVVAVAPDLWISLTDHARLKFLRSGEIAFQDATVLAFDYGRWGAVAVLLVVAETVRRRDLAAIEPGQRVVELGSAGGASVDADIREMLGDPSARLLWSGSEGQWVDSTGVSQPALEPGRSRVELADDSGRVVALLDHRADEEIPASVLEALAARLRLDLLRGESIAAARASVAEVRALQRALINAQDIARRRVERDLHDGSQQRLVGLALSAQLATRRGRGRAALARELAEAAEELVATAAGPPAALNQGLAAGLTTLAATSPVPVELHLDGDLDSADERAVTAWFVTSEAVANSLKHAGARSLSISLQVRGDVVLRIADDGRGGVTGVPRAIRERVEREGGTVGVDSPAGQGTVVTATLPLERVPA